MLDDFAAVCYNDTYFHTDVLENRSVYLDTMAYFLNATSTNWEYPELPGYVDIFAFNQTFFFDLNLLNDTVFQGRFRICVPEVASTTPAMLSGGAEGWTGETAVVRGSGARSRQPAWSSWLPLGFLLRLAFSGRGPGASRAEGRAQAARWQVVSRK